MQFNVSRFIEPIQFSFGFFRGKVGQISMKPSRYGEFLATKLIYKWLW